MNVFKIYDDFKPHCQMNASWEHWPKFQSVAGNHSMLSRHRTWPTSSHQHWTLGVHRTLASRWQQPGNCKNNLSQREAEHWIWRIPKGDFFHCKLQGGGGVIWTLYRKSKVISSVRNTGCVVIFWWQQGPQDNFSGNRTLFPSNHRFPLLASVTHSYSLLLPQKHSLHVTMLHVVITHNQSWLSILCRTISRCNNSEISLFTGVK